ncbi:MAG: hypothetical protein HY332_08755 [Chloroflexi bacterium]|nr:hypothetical protein [Chloroflexota bacterium]
MRAHPRSLPLVALLAVLGAGALPCHWTNGVTPTAEAQALVPQEIRLHLTEWALEPTVVNVVAGSVIRLVAVNEGALPHVLAVEGDDVYVETDAIGSGGSASLELSFPVAGRFDLFCPVGEGLHRVLGQEAELHVLASIDGLGLPGADDAAEATPLNQVQSAEYNVQSENACGFHLGLGLEGQDAVAQDDEAPVEGGELPAADE